MKLTEIQKAYMAGIIDGEGCIRVSKTKKVISHNYDYSARVSLFVSNKKLIDLFYKTFGGSISYPKIYSKLTKKRCWQWSVSYQKAIYVCKTLLPYLMEKKEQAREVIKIESTVHKTGRGRVLLNWAIQEKERIYRKLRSLKKGVTYVKN